MLPNQWQAINFKPMASHLQTYPHHRVHISLNIRLSDAGLWIAKGDETHDHEAP